MAPAGLLLALLLPFAGGEEPPGAPPAPPPSPVAAVVAAVAKSAAENAALPEKERVAGDALFDRYVRAAPPAGGGGRPPPPHRPRPPRGPRPPRWPPLWGRWRRGRGITPPSGRSGT